MHRVDPIMARLRNHAAVCRHFARHNAAPFERLKPHGTVMADARAIGGTSLYPAPSPR